MKREKALDIIFLTVKGNSARRIAEIFHDEQHKELAGNQLYGEDLIEQACVVLSLEVSDVYEQQRKYLDLQGDLNKALDNFSNRLFKQLCKDEPPSMRNILNRLMQTD